MNILIVEDNATDMKLSSAVLIASGHRVYERDSAEAALDEIKSRQPEVILLDLKLPGIDGLTLARRLKADSATCHILIVAITASPETFAREEAMAAGCDAYMCKPMDTRKLNDEIARAVAQASPSARRKPPP
jgi:CheY-like chemotaxis protein